MPENSDIFRGRGDHGGDATDDDMVISRSAYVEEIQAALERTEHAFKHGDHAGAAALAAEGLETIRISIPRLGAQNIPPYYEAFFHCFRMHDEFQAALRLFKSAVAGPGMRNREALARAWEILEPKAKCLDDKIQAERLVFEYPVAGRLLRGVMRLKDKLREMLDQVEG
jgi:hypothetical protein